jgi:hypothetical protein
VGEVITATATRADAGFGNFYDTSEFAQNVTAVAASDMDGTLYHDVDADADVAEGGTLSFASASVILYLDDGDSAIDAGDGLLASTTSDGSGNYAFSVYPDGTYYTVVDSKTLTATGYNGGFDIKVLPAPMAPCTAAVTRAPPMMLLPSPVPSMSFRRRFPEPTPAV